MVVRTQIQEGPAIALAAVLTVSAAAFTWWKRAGKRTIAGTITGARAGAVNCVGNPCRKTMPTKPGHLDIVGAMLIGYARVSTKDQDPIHQVDALRRGGVDPSNIYIDVASGAKASRPRFDLKMKVLREGDTLKVTRLDRLGRSVVHLVLLGAELRECGVGLHVIEQGIDTSTAEGRAMFGMLSVLAELQRELIVANTRDGLAAARARGRRGGRRPRLTPHQAEVAQQLYDAGKHTVQQIADMFGVPRSTVYGHLDKSSIGRRPGTADAGAVTPRNGGAA
jgi:DNA invertase Pin-like site-specific DNA recombinase